MLSLSFISQWACSSQRSLETSAAAVAAAAAAAADRVSGGGERGGVLSRAKERAGEQANVTGPRRCVCVSVLPCLCGHCVSVCVCASRRAQWTQCRG